MITSEIPADALTPLALQGVLDEIGGLVVGVVLAAEIETIEGQHHTVLFWDKDASPTLHVGLTALLSLTLDLQAQAAIEWDDDNE